MISIRTLQFLCVLSIVLLSACSHHRPAATTIAKSPRAVRLEPQPVYPELVEDDSGDEELGDSAANSPLRGVSSPLTGGAWLWLGILTPTEATKVDHPGNFSIQFKPDGWFDWHAECQEGEGLFVTRGERIVLSIKNSRAASPCKSAVLTENFLQTLDLAATYQVRGERLKFRMKREKKEMVFYRKKS
jgi:hypothetical protein